MDNEDIMVNDVFSLEKHIKQRETENPNAPELSELKEQLKRTIRAHNTLMAQLIGNYTSYSA